MATIPMFENVGIKQEILPPCFGWDWWRLFPTGIPSWTFHRGAFTSLIHQITRGSWWKAVESVALQAQDPCWKPHGWFFLNQLLWPTHMVTIWFHDFYHVFTMFLPCFLPWFIWSIVWFLPFDLEVDISGRPPMESLRFFIVLLNHVIACLFLAGIHSDSSNMVEFPDGDGEVSHLYHIRGYSFIEV